MVGYLLPFLVLGLGGLCMGTSSCDRHCELPAASSQDPQIDAPPETIESIVHNPSKYRGQTVWIDGEVAEVVGARVFILEDRRWLRVERIPVFVTNSANFAGGSLRRHQEVLVKGVVERYDRELERQLGGALDPRSKGRIQDRPIVLATWIPCVH
jgi:hypothetical protein